MLKQVIIIFSSVLLIASMVFAIELGEMAKAQPNPTKPGVNTTETKMSSNPITSSQLPEKAFIPIENLIVSKSSQGLVELSASVRNNHTFGIHDVTIEGEFFDKNGDSLGKIKEFVTNPSFVLKPGASHNFVALELISHYRVASSNFTATGEPVI